MSNLKLRALAGACALLGAAGLSGAARAQTTTTLSGGGSALAAPYWAQAVLCFDNDTQNKTYLLKGVPAVSALTLATTEIGCPHNKGSLIQYDSTGSGTGQAGLFAHAAVISDAAEGVMFGSTDAAGETAVYTSIQYGLSDSSLGGTDLATYEVGTGNTLTTIFFGNSASYTAPATYQGLTFSGDAPHVAGADAYPIPAQLYGPLVQFPVTIDPIAVTFNPTFGSGQTFNIQNGNVLELSKAAYCQIFAGVITDWNDPALTTLNDGVSLTGGTEVLIRPIGRSDSAGDTAIFTRHLATVCGTTAGGPLAGNPYASGTMTLPAGVFGLFTMADGATGVANAVKSTPASIAYIGADFVSPASAKTGATPGFTLPAAALQNNAGNFERPTGATALAAFGALTPPQSNSDGSFNPADATSDRRDPTQWVQSMAAGVPLANPTALAAYPIVGTTNFIAYTCYANAAQLTALKNFLTFNAQTLAGDFLNDASLAQLPANWITAIGNTFLTDTGEASELQLYFAMAGAGSTNSNCEDAVGG
ncbi:MAG: substrate-binding domain-containing protein [Caulobacteraceae bacterium]